MNENTVQVSTNQIIGAEETYASVVAELQLKNERLATAEAQYNELITINNQLKQQAKKLNNNQSNLNEQLETERKAKTEMYIQYQEEKLQLLTREKDLAIHEANFYKLQSEQGLSSHASPQPTIGKIPKIPEFQGSSVGFPRWISWISDLFNNYPNLSDFNKRIMVVDSLKGEARSWYDAEPDSSTTSWESLKDAMLKQYGGTNSISNALNTIASMKLSTTSDFNTFIQRIRPAIQLVAKSDNTLAIAILRQQIHTDIRRYLPEIQNESFTSFEQRLRLQFAELKSKQSFAQPLPQIAQTPMDVDAIVAPIRKFNSNNQSSLGGRQQTQFRQRNFQPHNSSNTTMTKQQFDEYVKNCICFQCGKRGHLKTSCYLLNKKPRTFNALENEVDDTEDHMGKDQA